MPWDTLLAMEKHPPKITMGLQAPKRARPRHRIAIMLHEAGWTNKDIARALGYTEARLSVILNSSNPILSATRAKFASEVADNIRDVQSRFSLYSNEMLDVLVHHARQKDQKPELSRLAARDILHMAGFSPVKKIFQANAQVPVEEMRHMLTGIQDANEVVLKQDEWKVEDREVKAS